MVVWVVESLPRNFLFESRVKYREGLKCFCYLFHFNCVSVPSVSGVLEMHVCPEQKKTYAGTQILMSDICIMTSKEYT